MGATTQDREYFRRIGEAKASCHAEATAAHSARSLDARLKKSVELYLRYRGRHRDRAADPSPFYARAHALGLYRP